MGIEIKKRFVIEDNVDILYTNKELKRLIKRIIKDNNLSVYYISKQIGVNYKMVLKWLHYMHTKVGNVLTHREIMKLAAILGITIKIQLIVCNDAIAPILQRKKGTRINYDIEDEALEDETYE